MIKEKERSFHRRHINNQEHIWFVDDLWRLADGLPFKEVPSESIIDLDKDGWFGKDLPNPRNILNHMKRILAADSYPVLLYPDGLIMDGAHRVCKAILLDIKMVKVVQFEHPPKPSKIIDL